MIESVEIEGFRGIAKAEIKGIRQLNVLIGPNNAGKSSLMQAFMLAFRQEQFYDWLGSRLGLFNGAARRTAFFADAARTKITTAEGQAIEQRLTHDDPWLNYSSGGGFRCSDLDAEHRWRDDFFWVGAGMAFLPSDPDSFGQPRRFEDLISGVILHGGRHQLVTLMRSLLPDITDIRVLTIQGEPILFIEEGEKLWPAASAGDGMKRLMGLAAFMALNVVLRFVEEPEAHHHPESARQAARVLWGAVEGNKQTFITTHSVPLLAELLDSADGREDKMRVFLVSRERGVVSAKSLSPEQARGKAHRNKILQALDSRWPG